LRRLFQISSSCSADWFSNNEYAENGFRKKT
jgi:hypothetical protein